MSPPTTRKPVGRYRALYARLPPSIQLIGMQLWLPVIFIVMFCLCYIAAFHAPRINDAPIGLVAPAATQIRATLQATTGQAVAYRIFAGTKKAEAAVRDGAAIAALVYPPKANAAPTLYLASAHQYQSANIAKTLLTPVIAGQGRRLAVADAVLCYAAAGAVLMAVGRPWRQRREVRRVLSGRSTMFADAQRANAERVRRMREKVLARYGVVTPTDVAAMQAEDATVGDPFLNYGRSLSAMQNDTPEAQNGHDPEAK